MCTPPEHSDGCLEDCPVSLPGCGAGTKMGSDACDGDANGQYSKCTTACSGTIGCCNGNGPEACHDGANNSDDHARADG